MRTDSKLVLKHLPGNTGDVRCLPCKYIYIRPQEGDERAFLFAIEGGAYSESPTRAIRTPAEPDVGKPGPPARPGPDEAESEWMGEVGQKKKMV